jgi:hypothetical protein
MAEKSERKEDQPKRVFSYYCFLVEHVFVENSIYVETKVWINTKFHSYCHLFT